MKQKKLAAVLLAGMFCCTGLAGCGDGGSTASSTDTGNTGAAASGASTAPAAEPAGDLTWDTADLSWRKDTSPVTFDCYIDFDWYALDTWGKDDVSKEITSRTGVSLNVTKSSDLNQLQVLLAADELPEMIFTTNQVERFMTQDVSYSFDELINEHAPEFMQLIDPVEIVNNTRDDGHFYTLRSHYNSSEAWADPRNLPSPGDSGLHVRQDIMEAIGNPKITSVEELRDVFATVKEKYPDMVVFQPHPTWADPFSEYYGFTSPTSTSLVDGKVIMNLAHPNFKDYMKYMNSLARDGYMSTEAYTYKPEQFIQVVRSGAVFCGSYNTSLSDETNLIFDQTNFDGRFVPVVAALTHEGKDDFAPLDSTTGWAYLFLSKKCKNPDRAIRYMEFLKSPEGDELTQWGIEGKHYTLTEDGLLQRPEGFENLKATDTGVGPWYFMASGLGEGVAVMSARVSTPDYATKCDLLEFRKSRYVRNPILSFATPVADSDEAVIKQKLVDLWTNSKVGIFSAADDAAFEAAFTEFESNCQKIGIEQLNEYYTECYNTAKAKYDAAGITF